MKWLKIVVSIKTPMASLEIILERNFSIKDQKKVSLELI